MKLVVTQFMTLDGVIGEPQNWSFPYWSDETQNFKVNELQNTDAHLLGRVTYQGFAASWPGQTDEQGFADRMNSLPKYVVSTTLKKAEWNNSHIVSQNVANEISKLKQQPGGNLLVAGSANLLQTLMTHDLVDEYYLLMYPIVLGEGLRLFPDGMAATLRLAESKPMGNGVILLRYEPAKK